MSFCFQQLKFCIAATGRRQRGQQQQQQQLRDDGNSSSNFHCHLIKNCRIIIFLFSHLFHFTRTLRSALPCLAVRKKEELLNKQKKRWAQFENLQISANAAQMKKTTGKWGKLNAKWGNAKWGNGRRESKIKKCAKCEMAKMEKKKNGKREKEKKRKK